MSEVVAVVSEADANVVAEMLAASRKHNWDRVASLLHPDVVWDLPGDSLISGRAVGADAVVARARIIADANLTVEPQHIHIGSCSIVATIHNTAAHPTELDEWLALVFTMRSGCIGTIDTHLSDVPMLTRFYGPLRAEVAHQ